MNQDIIESLCKLDEKQTKAFINLKKAYNKCLKSGIYFHQVLETLQAYNGNNISDINDNPEEGFCTQKLSINSMKITSGWADDNHYVHFQKDKI